MMRKMPQRTPVRLSKKSAKLGIKLGMTPRKKADMVYRLIGMATQTSLVAMILAIRVAAIPASKPNRHDGGLISPPVYFYLNGLYNLSMRRTNPQKKKNPVCVVYWNDAAYSYEDKLPDNPPQLQLTAGFVIKATDNYINITTNVNFNKANGRLSPVDGFVLPRSAMVRFKKIGWLNS
jgi:hypothetical protein